MRVEGDMVVLLIGVTSINRQKGIVFNGKVSVVSCLSCWVWTVLGNPRQYEKLENSEASSVVSQSVPQKGESLYGIEITLRGLYGKGKVGTLLGPTVRASLQWKVRHCFFLII